MSVYQCADKVQFADSALKFISRSFGIAHRQCRKASKSVWISSDCRMRGIIRLLSEFNCDRRLQFLRARYSVGKNLNIDSSRIHRCNPFVVEIVDTRGNALRWVTGESTQFLPLFINLLNRISFVGFRDGMYFVMLFKGDDLHDLILLSKVRMSESFAAY